MHRALAAACFAGVLMASSGIAHGQQPAGSAQRPADKPPVAHAWMDLATFSSPGMPGGMAALMGGMAGGSGGGSTPLSALMGGNQANQFGFTQFGGSGRYMDVTLRTSRNPSLGEALQSVPANSQLAPTLQLKVLPQAKPVPDNYESSDPVENAPQQPKGKIKLYWGCGTEIRPGQPKVVDFTTGTVSDLGAIFQGRRATQRGTHSAPGRPVWPNLTDQRMIPAGATLAGNHAFAGEGVPENFEFKLPQAQDLMPAIALQQAAAGGVTQLTWQVLPTARAYFIAAMGGSGDARGEGAEMTLWTSSEVPDSGFGLVDYQTNKSVDQWLQDKVLLAPATTACSIPKGVFGEGEAGMLRMIAYGTEINLAHPPRPDDPKLAWEPDWALKVRLKSVASAILGMSAMDGGDGADGAALGSDGAGAAEGDAAAEEPKKKKKFSFKDALEVVKQGVPVP